MLKQSILLLNKAIVDAKKNRDPKDTLKVKLTEKDAAEMLFYLKSLESFQNQMRDIK